MAEYVQQGRDQERALLAAVLRRPTLYDDLAETIRVEHFGWKAYGEAWQAMGILRGNNLSIDPLTVGDELERIGKLATFKEHDVSTFSGRAALSNVREQGEPESAQTYAENILDYYAKAQFAALFQQGYHWAVNGRKASAIALDITARMSAIRTPGSRAFQHTKTLKEAVSAAYDQTDKASRGQVEFVQTGYIDLDKLLCGISAPDLMIVAGRPGSGKTALLASILKNIYDRQKKRVIVFSLEMSNEQIAKRLIAMESGVSFDRQKTGKLTDEDWPAFNHAIEKLGNLQGIYLNDLPAITISQIRQQLRQVEVDLVMLDYLQLAGVDGRRENRNVEVGEISRGLKEIAKDFDVPIIAAAQLSRAVEQRAGKEPHLSDLRESGSIEQDSDVVAFIWKAEREMNTSIVKVAKNRNGPTGIVQLTYRKELTRFENKIREISS